MNIVKRITLLKEIYSSESRFDSKLGVSVHPIPPSITESDLEELNADGYFPNQFITYEHDAVLSNLQQLTKSWIIEEAAAAFVAGLWSAPFYCRSALTAKLLAEAMPEHVYTPYSESSQICTICGFHNSIVDTTLEWYLSLVSGTSLDGEPVGQVLALEEMLKSEQKLIPNEFDCWTFRAILTVIRNLPPKTRYSKARDILKKEGLLPTKKTWAYGSLLETLALIGVLDTPAQPGMAREFRTYQQRDHRPNDRVEVQAPLVWWDSSIGINKSLLEKLFSKFDCSSVSLESKPQPKPRVKETMTGILDKAKSTRATIPKQSKTAGKGLIEAGDVYAIRIREGVWITAYCHEVKMAHTLVAKMEYLDGVFKEMPREDQLIFAFKGRRDGRSQSWCASMDKTSWVRRVARNYPTPQTNEPESDRIPVGGAKDLFHLADWCFSEL